MHSIHSIYGAQVGCPRIHSQIKKSKFVTTAWPVISAAHAMEMIKGASDSSATHNCMGRALLLVTILINPVNV